MAERLETGKHGVIACGKAGGKFEWEVEMRLTERGTQTVHIAPRAVAQNGAEAFSQQRIAVRAKIVPVAGGLESHAAGLWNSAKMCLLLPSGCGIRVGDGLCLQGTEVDWRCVSVKEWFSHVTAQFQRIAGA